MEGKSSMSNQQILEKAIQKAIDGGWNKLYYNTSLWSSHELAEYIYHAETIRLTNLIYNHDFAKALWGANTPTTDGKGVAYTTREDKVWQYHLQQMVIAEDPIKYLGDNL